MSVVIVGDIDVDKMEEEIKARFGKLQNNASPRKKEANNVPKHKETLVSIVSDKEAPFTNIQLMYKHDHVTTKTLKEYRESIVRRLYNSMLGARLDELAQSAEPPFNFAYTGYSSDLGNIDSYSSYAMVPEGGAEKGLRVLLEENERVLRHGFTAGELERAKTDILTGMERAYKERDKTDSRRFASRYVAHFVDDVNIPSIGDEIKLYKDFLPTITLKEIDGLAKKWVTDENRVVVITGPEKASAPLPDEGLVRSILEEVKKAEITPYVDNVSDAPLLADIPIPAEIKEERQMENIGVTELELANGVKVVLKPTDFKNDEVLISAFSPGGSSLYSDEDYPSASNAARVIDASGIGEFDLTQLQKKLTGKTLNISPYISEMYEGFNGFSSPKDLETTLQLVHLYFTAPRKDEAALQSYVAKQSSIFKNLMANPDYWFSDQVSKIAYRNHTRRGFPTEEQLQNIKLDRVVDIYKERFADASDFTFFFTGNFDMETIKPLVATYLGSLPSTYRKENFKDVNANYINGAIKKSLTRGSAPKAQVNIIYHGDFKWDAVNRYNFKSMIDVLRIKMRESMREDKGGVYGVRVSGNTSQFPNPEYSINISFNADPPMVEELIKTAKADINYARHNGADEKDLTKVKETQRQSRIKDLKENRFWNNNLRFVYQNNLDPSIIELDNFEESINGLTSDDIKNAAKLYFDGNKVIQVTMMPAEGTEN